MRIVGGKYRSRQIIWPEDSLHIRPTKDRVREAIFNAIGDINGASVLDLYAGSGAMGIEALSRGAKHAYFVDINNVALSTIKKNVSSLKITPDEYSIYAICDVSAIEKMKNEGVKFDVVILDPPYKEGKYEDIILLLINNGMLNKNAIIINECDRYLELDKIENVTRRDYHYGETKVSILWRK